MLDIPIIFLFFYGNISYLKKIFKKKRGGGGDPSKKHPKMKCKNIKNIKIRPPAPTPEKQSRTTKWFSVIWPHAFLKNRKEEALCFSFLVLFFFLTFISLTYVNLCFYRSIIFLSYHIVCNSFVFFLLSPYLMLFFVFIILSLSLSVLSYHYSLSLLLCYSLF